jgi:predicted helicase
MRFPKKGQKDTIIYNSKILVSNIPEKAYEYVVNGKSAIDWIMERYAVKPTKTAASKTTPTIGQKKSATHATFWICLPKLSVSSM